MRDYIVFDAKSNILETFGEKNHRFAVAHVLGRLGNYQGDFHVCYAPLEEDTEGIMRKEGREIRIEYRRPSGNIRREVINLG